MFPFQAVDGGGLLGEGGVGVAIIGLEGGQNITQSGGFAEVVIGTEFDRFNCRGNAGITGENDNL